MTDSPAKTTSENPETEGVSSLESRGTIMRLMRFRVRTLMIAVGVVALLIWGAMMGTRSYVHSRLARIYGDRERQLRAMVVRDRGMPARSRSITAVWGPQMADDLAWLARRHRRAMWRPWMPVAPDPPYLYYPPRSQ